MTNDVDAPHGRCTSKDVDSHHHLIFPYTLPRLSRTRLIKIECMGEICRTCKCNSVTFLLHMVCLSSRGCDMPQECKYNSWAILSQNVQKLYVRSWTHNSDRLLDPKCYRSTQMRSGLCHETHRTQDISHEPSHPIAACEWMDA